MGHGHDDHLLLANSKDDEVRKSRDHAISMATVEPSKSLRLGDDSRHRRCNFHIEFECSTRAPLGVPVECLFKVLLCEPVKDDVSHWALIEPLFVVELPPTE